MDMQNLISPKIVKELMMRHGVAFNKGLGQNFLVDRNILKKIVDAADLKKQDMVLEIGAGIGTLTRELAERAELVVSVEIDKRLFPILNETLSCCPNVKVIHGDILKLDMDNLIKENISINQEVLPQPFIKCHPMPHHQLFNNFWRNKILHIHTIILENKSSHFFGQISCIVLLFP
jgi:SAM-dependent methyltransferase